MTRDVNRERDDRSESLFQNTTFVSSHGIGKMNREDNIRIETDGAVLNSNYTIVVCKDRRTMNSLRKEEMMQNYTRAMTEAHRIQIPQMGHESSMPPLLGPNEDLEDEDFDPSNPDVVGELKYGAYNSGTRKHGLTKVKTRDRVF